MIKVEVVWEALDTGDLSSRIFNTEAGETVEYYATRIYGFRVPRIVAWEEYDGEPQGFVPLALDDVVTYSSRLILRARIPEEDTHLMFMYREHGTAYVPVGGMSFADNMALLELDPYDCAMVLAKRILERSKDSRDNEVQEAARRLLKSKPPFEDLKASAAAAYSTKQPTDEDLLYEFYQNRNSRIPVDPSAKVSESIKLLRGRRRCHMILLQRARSADDPSAKPAPPRGASEELPAVKPKGRRSSFIIFCDKQRPALEKKGMSPREIGRKCGELWSVLTPEEMQKYQALADEDAVRYMKENQLYAESLRTRSIQEMRRAEETAAKPPPPPADEPAATPAPAPELLTGAAGLLQILDEFKIKNGGVDDPYYAAMRGALEELEIEERDNPPRPL